MEMWQTLFFGAPKSLHMVTSATKLKRLLLLGRKAITNLDSILKSRDYFAYKGQSAAAAAKSLQSYPTLRDPINGSPPGSAIPGIFQARTLEWVAISFSNAWKWKVKVKSESEVAQSCPTLCDPMDSSLPGSSVHGIFQARVLEWVAIAFSIDVRVGL